MKKWLVLLCLPLFALTTLSWTAASWAAVEMHQFDNAQQEADYRALIQELRCPQCQNNNIADSNATIATDMRHKTLELLKQGKNKDEVVHYMVERYGNFVTYDPPLTPATLLLWLMPLLLIGGGFWLVRRKKARPQAVGSEPNFADRPLDQDRLNQILNSSSNPTSQQKEKQ